MTRDDTVVFKKLSRALSAEQALHVFGSVLTELGLSELASPDDRLRFGHALTQREGGLENALGRAISIQAILQGATGP